MNSKIVCTFLIMYTRKRKESSFFLIEYLKRINLMLFKLVASDCYCHITSLADHPSLLTLSCAFAVLSFKKIFRHLKPFIISNKSSKVSYDYYHSPIIIWLCQSKKIRGMKSLTQTFFARLTYHGRNLLINENFKHI